jgi:hypothetical protein
MPNTIMGTSEKPPTRATANVEEVISYTCRPIATTVSCDPMPEIAVPIQSRANGGLALSGVKSTKWLRRVAGSAARESCGGSGMLTGGFSAPRSWRRTARSAG